MHLAPVRTQAPALQPVTLDEVRQYLRVDVGEDDILIQSYIDAAVHLFDGWAGVLGRCLITQQWSVSLHDWPPCRVRLPFPGARNVAIAYRDMAGAPQVVPDGQYQVFDDAQGTVVAFLSSFSAPAVQCERADAVTITFIAGYGDTPAAIPGPIRVAILLLVSHWYQNREAVGDATLAALPFAVDALIAPYRRVGV